MLERLDSATVAALKQILAGFGGFFLLALLLNIVGGKIRTLLQARLGRAYNYLVQPGTSCSAFGRWIACLLTFTKVSERLFVDFSGRSLGYVKYELPRGSVLSPLRRFVVETAPVWFGCAVVTLIAALAGGTGLLPDVKWIVPDQTVPIPTYVTKVAMGGVGMFTSMVGVWHWTSPFCLVCLYLFLCIASEISLGEQEFRQIWSGTLILAVFLFLLNLIPCVGPGIEKLMRYLLPHVFVLHTILFFVFLFNVAFYLLLRIFIRKRKAKPETKV